MNGVRSSWPVIAALVLLAACTTHRPPPSPPVGTTLAGPQTPSPEASIYGYRAYCGQSPNCPDGSVPAQLRRPLHLPPIHLGQPCPYTPPRQVNDQFGPAMGGGPVYPVIGGRQGKAGIVDFEYPPPADSLFAGSDYGGQQILWIIDPAYRGPTLIRSQQLDGTNPVGYGNNKPLPELQLPPAGDHTEQAWRTFGTEVRLKAAGCYAWQIDGTDFSNVIVFNARISTG